MNKVAALLPRNRRRCRLNKIQKIALGVLGLIIVGRAFVGFHSPGATSDRSQTANSTASLISTGDFPDFNVEQDCKEEAKSSFKALHAMEKYGGELQSAEATLALRMGQGPGRDYDECIHSQQTAYDHLKPRWMRFSLNTRMRCGSESSGSYEKLQACVADPVKFECEADSRNCPPPPPHATFKK